MKKDELREALLSTGEQLFRRHGYKPVTIASITDAAGVATGSFYRCFASKARLFEAVLDRSEQRAIQDIEAVIKEFKSPLSKLKALFRYAARTARTDPVVRGVLHGDRKFRFSGAQSRKAKGAAFRERLAALVSEVIIEGDRRLALRAGIFRDPTGLFMALLDSILEEGEAESARTLTHDALLLLERGFRRQIRLRPRLESIEHRRIIDREA